MHEKEKKSMETLKSRITVKEGTPNWFDVKEVVPLSKREGVFIHSFVCQKCRLHFNLYSWQAENHPNENITCPECGQKGEFYSTVTRINDSKEFTNGENEIFQHCPITKFAETKAKKLSNAQDVLFSWEALRKSGKTDGKMIGYDAHRESNQLKLNEAINNAEEGSFITLKTKQVFGNENLFVAFSTCAELFVKYIHRDFKEGYVLVLKSLKESLNVNASSHDSVVENTEFPQWYFYCYFGNSLFRFKAIMFMCKTDKQKGSFRPCLLVSCVNEHHVTK
jgi:hypothetical protein